MIVLGLYNIYFNTNTLIDIKISPPCSSLYFPPPGGADQVDKENHGNGSCESPKRDK